MVDRTAEAVLLAVVCCTLGCASASVPRWYILTPEDVPEEHRGNDIVQQMNNSLIEAGKRGSYTCLGVEGPTDEFYISNDLVWQCWMLTHFMQSPLRTYHMDSADFVIVPSPPPAGLSAHESDPTYFITAQKLFPHYHSKPHVLVLRWQPSKQLLGIKKAPEVARHFIWLLQQYPYYLFPGGELYRRYMFQQIPELQHYSPEQHPEIAALQHNMVGAPWLAMLKLSFGSRYYHTPLDMEHLRKTKKVKTQGMYEVRFPWREYLHAQCNKAPGCHSIDRIAREDERFNFVDVYLEAWTSLQPQGDDPTRTAMFDSWLCDCIPIHLAEAKHVIPYLPFNDIINYETIGLFHRYIGKAQKHGDENYMVEFMESLDLDKVEEMIHTAHNISHVFSYNKHPYHLAIGFDTLQEIHPFDDAFTMTVKALLRTLCNRHLIAAGRCPSHRLAPLHDGIALPLGYTS